MSAIITRSTLNSFLNASMVHYCHVQMHGGVLFLHTAQYSIPIQISRLAKCSQNSLLSPSPVHTLVLMSSARTRRAPGCYRAFSHRLPWTCGSISKRTSLSSPIPCLCPRGVPRTADLKGAVDQSPVPHLPAFSLSITSVVVRGRLSGFLPTGRTRHTGTFYRCKLDSNSLYFSIIGDILININGTSTEGCSHREIVNLIKSAGNILSLLTMNKNSVKKSELETRLYFLKKTLQEKWVEYKSLLLQEQRLVHGFLRNNNLTESSNSFLFDDTVLFGSTAQKKERFSSDSSCRSQLSFMTDDSEDRVFQPGMHDDLVTGNHRRRSSMDEDCVFHREAEMFAPKSQLSRSRSISMTSSSGSSSVASPSWDVNGGYGTISRKSRRPSVRKRLMKFIPGLNRADEEDESHL
ncbi:cytohesin-interacting protein isoform X1 [Leucoraja erinacea]|uniref:cytohesin-interacting protein isoform X1 n=1 Tax=Leucoraja erinaceus TaxID=7782 RepID=UPI0024579620|nr:cytohesin-interacting protein isoform X1 [Leucoraja erinacea]